MRRQGTDMSMLPTLKVTGRKTLQENVYDSLKLALMSGEFAPGQQLTVRAITELAGTSPMPVRDAMRRLVAEGALEMQPNGLMRVRLMNLEQRDEAREIRQALEGLALRRAARFVTPDELAEIAARDAAMQQALAAGKLRQAIYHNREFHFAIYRAARAPALFQLIEGQWMQNGPFLLLYAETFLATDRQAHNARTNHQSMLQALTERDADAAERAIEADIASTALLGAEGPVRESNEHPQRPRPAIKTRRRALS
jgi:DNA-binding GntR family transcriptional regulator